MKIIVQLGDAEYKEAVHKIHNREGITEKLELKTKAN